MSGNVAKSNSTTTNWTGNELHGESKEHLSADGEPSEAKANASNIHHVP